MSTGFKWLFLLHLCLDVDGIETIVGDFATHDLPEKRAKSEDIHFVIILTLLEELRRHIGRGTRKLHGPLAKVSL